MILSIKLVSYKVFFKNHFWGFDQMFVETLAARGSLWWPFRQPVLPNRKVSWDAMKCVRTLRTSKQLLWYKQIHNIINRVQVWLCTAMPTNRQTNRVNKVACMRLKTRIRCGVWACIGHKTRQTIKQGVTQTQSVNIILPPWARIRDKISFLIEIVALRP